MMKCFCVSGQIQMNKDYADYLKEEQEADRSEDYQNGKIERELIL